MGQVGVAVVERHDDTNLLAATVRARSAVVGAVYAASATAIDLGDFACLRERGSEHRSR